MNRQGFGLILLFLSFCITPALTAQKPKEIEVEAGPLPVANAPKPADPMAVADDMFESGRYDDSAKAYEAIVAANPASIPARVGVIRSRLKAGDVKEAMDYATESRKAYPNANGLTVAMGEVLYRRGEIAAAEKEFTTAWLTEPQNTRAVLALAKIYDALSLHKRAYMMLKSAHETAPNDPEVRKAWSRTLSRAQRIKDLEERLAHLKSDDADERGELERELEFLKALESVPRHRCELASHVESTETDLKPLLYDVKRVRGWGLDVTLNSRKMRLLLDTGASGITISRTQAEKAGLKKLSVSLGSGIGDKGPVMGYTAYAESIQVGGLEFHDCIVDVIDKRNVAEDDGLIGADVFSNYLVNIDFPGRKLKLGPLPKRPDETAPAVASLNTTGDSAKDEPKSDAAKPEELLPKDRYISPEMRTWTPVYRYGHLLLLPTKVNDGAPRLFLIDTGAFSTTFSTDLAKEVTKVSRDIYTHVKGISGNVENVYQADKATLEFAHLKQRNEDVVTFDLSRIGRPAGTEVSGILGFSVLFLLEVKIDYRDGLVDFVYDAKKTHTEDWRR